MLYSYKMSAHGWDEFTLRTRNWVRSGRDICVIAVGFGLSAPYHTTDYVFYMIVYLNSKTRASKSTEAPLPEKNTGDRKKYWKILLKKYSQKKKRGHSECWFWSWSKSAFWVLRLSSKKLNLSEMPVRLCWLPNRRKGKQTNKKTIKQNKKGYHSSDKAPKASERGYFNLGASGSFAPWNPPRARPLDRGFTTSCSRMVPPSLKNFG